MRDSLHLPDSDLRLEFSEQGEGSALLFLHGFDGPRCEAPFLRALAKTHRVIAPVHPGFENSSGGTDCREMLDVVILYQELIVRLGLKRPTVIGHSLGGMFAAELAATSPELLGGLVLVAPFGIWLEATPVPDFLPMKEEMLERLTWSEPKRRKACASETTASDEAAVLVAKAQRMSNLAAAANYLWPIPDHGLSKRLARIKISTLIVWGDADGLMGLEYANEFQSRIPDATLRVIHDAGHFPMLEQEASFLSCVRAFLASR
jgi:pimeloyl-ACP methyl ester carboxylesterase